MKIFHVFNQIQVEAENGLNAKASILSEAIRIVLFPLFVFNIINAPLAGHFFCKSVFRFTLRGYSSAGRAPALQAGGQRFDPAYLHHSIGRLKMDSLKWERRALSQAERDRQAFMLYLHYGNIAQLVRAHA